MPPVQIFGNTTWNVFELRSQLGIVTTDLHHRFVNGNAAGSISGVQAVLSGFFATQGFVNDESLTEEMHEKATDALRRLEADHLGAKPLDEMSTGEARRVLIARALVSEPKALVLDEPTAGLDLVARHRFLKLVSRIAREGTTVVLVTHHVEEIIPEIEHVVLLKRGQVAFAGPKSSILTPAPRDEGFKSLVFDYEHADETERRRGEPDAKKLLKEINGYYYAKSQE